MTWWMVPSTLGWDISSTVLSGIAGALDSVGIP